MQPIISLTPSLDSHENISPTFKKTPKSNKFADHSPNNHEKSQFSSPKSSPINKKSQYIRSIIPLKSMNAPLKSAGLPRNSIAHLIKHRRASEILMISKAVIVPKLRNNEKLKKSGKDNLFRFKELLEIKDIWYKTEGFYYESRKLLKKVF